MKYKLLKDTPLHKAGIIVIPSERLYIPVGGGYPFVDMCVENNPKWFEPVEEFEKRFTITEYPIGGFVLEETFETDPQAMKELKEHIYKFPEPEIGEEYYTSNTIGREFIRFHNYNKCLRDVIDYRAGAIMNKNTTKADREARLKLLKKAYQL